MQAETGLFKQTIAPVTIALLIMYGGGRLLSVDTPTQEVTPIVFHGKVLDQFGAPVPDAHLAYTVRPNPAGQTLKSSDRYSVTGMLKTNARGAFEIRDTGGYLYIEQTYKPGYLFEPVAQPFIYKSSKYCYDGSPYCPAHTIHVPDPAHPVVINAWKITETSATLETGEETYTYKMNGQPFRVPMEGLEQGLFAAFTRLPSESEQFRERPWKVTFTLPGGGIVETDEYFMFEAPADGYVPELEFESTGERWIERKFYLRAEGGKVHARMKLKFTGFYGNGKDRKGFISYSYVLNSAYSSLLLPDVGPHFKQWPR